MTTISCFW